MKRFIFLVLLVVSVTTIYGLSDELAVDLQYFNMADTVTEQYGIVKGVVDAKKPDAGEFYAAVLDRLLREYPSVKGNQEVNAADNLAQLVTDALGNEKYQDAGQNLWKTVETFSDPLVKQNALIAMGKIGVTDLLPQVVQLLNDLNAHPRSDQAAKESGERIATGAIIALENYKDISGYLPVFFASTGWYHERVKSQAQAALPRITEDPAEPLTSVIQSPAYLYSIKYEALQTCERSWMPSDKKAMVALVALTEAWRVSTNDIRYRMDLVRMRKLALTMIRSYGIQDPAVYPLVERCYKEGSDEEEKLGAVYTLTALGTEDAAKMLSSFLMDITTKLQDGTLTRGDERMVRAIIPALGETKRSSGASALRAVQAAGWTSTVKRLAADALKKIGG
ncbi:MAG: hypothetical protein LBG76_10445 [Treponema sp.]|jgi:HEAT repeat protein|nr:hypothetical protein [Treponema sp.]